MSVQAEVSALKLLALGYSVIPSGGGPSGKAPLVVWQEYQKRLPTEAEILGWEEKLKPRLWGIVTGAVSGVAVVDCDAPEAEAMMGELAPQVRTPRGGGHWYLRHPDHHVRTVAGVLPGLDIRGDGGFANILGPGYTVLRLPTPEDLYPWEKLPEAIRLALAPPSRPAAPPLGDGAIPERTRNQRLTRIAGALRRQGVTQEVIEAALMRVNASQCTPPLAETEVLAIARSVARYEPTPDGRQPVPVAPDGAPWPPMQKLPPACPPVPNLPPEMVPDPLREWLVDTAQRASIPLELVACPAIIATGAVVGRRLGIRPVGFDDYLVVPNLWGGIVAPPGTLKTFAAEQGVKPLARLAAKAKEQFKQDESEHLARRERLKVELEAIRQEMGQAAKGKQEGVSDMASLEREYAAKAQELAEATGYEQRYMTQDATTEKLGELLQQNPRGLLVLRDELAGWLRTLDKPGREGDREFYLEAWNGTGDYTFDRIGRGTVHIDAVCLSIVGGIQPGKLRGYIHEAIEGEAGADGLLQRLQLLVWPDSLGKWHQVDRLPNSGARDRAFRVFERLDSLDPQKVGAEIKERETPALRFSPDAQQLFNEWRAELENRLRSSEMEDTPAFAAHLAKYRSLMPSLALLFHLVNLSQMGDEGVVGGSGEKHGSFKAGVSLGATKLAAAWCEFLEAHAKKVYAAELYPGVEAAHTLASKLKQKVIADGEPIRNIYRREWTGLNSPSQVNRALAVLEEFGWVRVIVQEAGERGGRPSEIVRINPKVWENEDG